MQPLFCLSDFLSSNQDHFWYALSGIGATGTLFIAFFALNTWRKQKEYELIIENLSACNLAVYYIEAQRFPATSTSEIKKEYLEEIAKKTFENDREKGLAESLFIYQSRRDKYEAIFEKILNLREKNWAVYGKEHDFYLFFNRIYELDKKILTANIRKYTMLKDREEYPEAVIKEAMREIDPIIYSKFKDDPIDKELAEWINKLEKYRKKR
jgi:hypothetical protein